METRESKTGIGTVLRYALLLLLAFLFLLPFYIIVRNALMTSDQITSSTWRWLPSPPQWGNFSKLFNNPEAPMLTGLSNSLFIAVVTLVLQMLFSSMAGYALARIPARGRSVVFFVIVATLMIPGAVTFVPSYAVMAYLNGVNTRWGIIAPGVFSAFSIFLFRQFYLRFPAEIEEAGRLDGLSYFGVYWRLLMPNSVSIVMALGILTFIGSWNSFLWPLVIGQDPSAWTVQVVLSTFLTAQTIDLAQLFTAAAVGVAPLGYRVFADAALYRGRREIFEWQRMKLFCRLIALQVLALCFLSFFAPAPAIETDAVARDPSTIVKRGDTYWVYGTGRGIPQWSSTDLRHWTRQGSVFETLPAWVKTAVPAITSNIVWAPDVHQVGERYFLYYSVSTFGSNVSTIGRRHNDTLDPRQLERCGNGRAIEARRTFQRH